MEPERPPVRNASTLSSTSISVPSSRYNLRNRGPAPFTKMAERECPICLSSVYVAPVVLNCEHTICGPCVKAVMAKFKNCPICNKVLIRSLFLTDTSYTRKLTVRNRSPVKSVSRTVRAIKSEPPADFARQVTNETERLSRKRRLKEEQSTPERSGSVVLSVTPMDNNRVLSRIVY